MDHLGEREEIELDSRRPKTEDTFQLSELERSHLEESQLET